jgi:hypothetical protein
MKKIEPGQTVTFLANLGVMAGIVFLAVEIRQNQVSLDEANAISRATALHEAISEFSEFRSLSIESEEISELWLKGIAGEELTSTEALRFDGMCQDLFAELAVTHRSAILLGENEVAGEAVGTMRGLGRLDARMNVAQRGVALLRASIHGYQAERSSSSF